MKELFDDITGSEKWETVEFLDKGWSNDKKYHIITDIGHHLLLRISKPETYEGKRQEFEIIKKLSVLDFEMSKATDFGICNEGVYMLLGWIKGIDIEEAIEKLNPMEQYQLGCEAGEILKKIHELKVEVEPFSWEEKFNRKIDRKIQMYEDCPLKYDNGHLFVECLNKSRQSLKNRPIAMHHGDYHVGNMVYSESGHVGIIDFGRFDYGDPWEEFNRIVWDVQSSPVFATGRVDGYFNREVPEEFFKLLAVYIASNILSSLPWAVSFGQEEIETMKKLARDNLDAFDNFTRIIPKWYSETKHDLNI